MVELVGELVESMKQNEMRLQQTFDKMLKKVLSDAPMKARGTIPLYCSKAFDIKEPNEAYMLK